ncbi:hypothetical protein JCM9279_001331 [Rhodotorula babjevae]
MEELTRTRHEQLTGPADKDAVNAFLAKHKPSSADISVGPWIWVRLPRSDDKHKMADELGEEDHAYVKVTAEGQPLIDALMERLDEIKATAPARANKARGLRSQKDLREEAHANFKAEIKELAQKHKVLDGKWLFYLSPENVDFVWSKIVHAVVDKDGPLAKTGTVHCAKVATTPLGGDGDRGSTHVICVYCDDSFDEEAVGNVFKVLVKDLGQVSQSYKPDVLTVLGIDSKHASGHPVSLYKRTTFMTKDDVDAAVEARANKADAKVKTAKVKTLEDEQASGAADGFDPVSESEDDKPRKKARKRE